MFGFWGHSQGGAKDAPLMVHFQNVLSSRCFVSALYKATYMFYQHPTGPLNAHPKHAMDLCNPTIHYHNARHHLITSTNITLV